MKKEIMSSKRLNESLTIPDLTDPKNGINAINIIVNKIIHSLKTTYTESAVEEFRISPKVSVKENFDDLLFPIDNAGRSSRYTRYVDSNTVLRTHTSASIPRLIKEKTPDNINDTIIIVPGMCYRRDVVDKNHCGEPHQMDVWRIKRGNPRLERSELIYLFETVLKCVAPSYKYKANETKHPYTINGLEIEILVNENWLEILECGEIHPKILENSGFNPKEYSGLALGMGLDRMIMVLKNIDDIRILRSNDQRIKDQMVNLDKFIKVSNQPATTRVLSYSTSIEKTEEDVCEEIKDELGANAIYLEEIKYSEISYKDLPIKAKENLGIHWDQKNIIATLIFRSLENSLQRTMVNEWMQRLYPKLNKGDKGYM